jgi:CheY-like chemotaxis protein
MPAWRILIADDSATVRRLVRGTLEFRGYEVIEASTGDEALRALEPRPRPDLAILDLRMPGRDGLDVLRWLRQTESGDDRVGTPLPVIVLTADDKENERAREAGASLFLVKPFKPVELLDAVGALLGN